MRLQLYKKRKKKTKKKEPKKSEFKKLFHVPIDSDPRVYTFNFVFYYSSGSGIVLMNSMDLALILRIV